MKQKFSILTALFLCWALAGSARAAEPEGNTRDVLAYKDGDRVQGRLVEKKGEIIVFQSDRFGELHVPADKAVVIPAEKPVEPAPPAVMAGTRPAVATAKETAKAAERAEAERVSLWEWFSPAVLTAKLRDVFGSWHGKFAFSSEVVSDTADRSNLSLETQLQRKWKADEVQLKGRYDFSQTNNLTTTDAIKADGLWQHDFTKDRFIQYRPSVEWNRASFKLGVPNDYVLLQQEIGAGLSLLATAKNKVRVGVSENLFNVWSIAPVDAHASRTTESAFVETELKLPWRMLLAQRGIYYLSFFSGKDGWENRIELSKKFTETLSTAIRHEIRRDNPDGRAPDYTRLKLLFAVDF